MSFVSSIGPNHPISEISTSHVYRLKKTRNEGDQKLRIFLIKSLKREWGHSAIYSEFQVVELLQWGRRSWNILKIGPSYPISRYLFWLGKVLERQLLSKGASTKNFRHA